MLSEFFQRFDESYDLQIHEIALRFPNLPKAFDGLRVLHISDIHHGEMLSPNYYHHVVEQAVALKADMVVVTGDFPATDNSYKESIEILSPLKPPMGIWAVRGNHDFYTEPELIAHWIKEHGIGLLSNCYKDFEREGQKLRLIGVEHPFLDVTDWDALMGPDEGGEPIFRLALSHVPDNIRNLSRAGADLVLSGHTHGGQWRLPLIGPLVIPSIYGRRYDQGLKQVGKSLLYVSRGMGIHTIPLRFNCPPEIAVFDLRRG